jgi:hypothetical protein
MAPPIRMRFVLASALLAAACSSKSSNPDAPQVVDDRPGTPDAPATDAPNGPDAHPADAKNGFTLHMVNQAAWCTITVNGTKGAAGATPPDTVYAKDTVVTLHADPDTPFVWGFWLGTDGQTDAGQPHDTNQDATVTMSADKTVEVCCPISGQPTCP